MQRVPQAAGDEEAGECKEEDHADPAGFGEVAKQAHGRVMRAQAAAVVEDEDHQDGEAAQAVECGIVMSLRGGG